MDDLVPALREAGYVVREVRYVDTNGRRIAGTSVDGFLRVSGGRYITVPRADLSALIFRSLGDRVETIFGDTIAAIEESPAAVHVTFASGAVRDFDLVVGADGVHSEVRRIVFGPQERFERYLGICAAAYTLDGYAPRDELVYVLYSEIGRQAARFAMRDGQTLVLLTFRDPEGAPLGGSGRAERAAAKRFCGAGWECPRTPGPARPRQPTCISIASAKYGLRPASHGSADEWSCSATPLRAFRCWPARAAAWPWRLPTS